MPNARLACLRSSDPFGTPVGAHDLWLAATAVAHGLALATTNVRELERVPGLAVAGWPAGDGMADDRSAQPVDG